jgi:uncharacterized membrane protein
MARLEFYAVAAQVIPVLFIVLAFQMRYFESWGEGGWWRSGRIFDWIILGAVVVGEGVSLYVLQRGDGTRLTEGLVEFALIALGVGIVYLTVRELPRRLRRLDQLELLAGLQQALGTQDQVERLREDIRRLRAEVEAREREES